MALLYVYSFFFSFFFFLAVVCGSAITTTSMEYGVVLWYGPSNWHMACGNCLDGIFMHSNAVFFLLFSFFFFVKLLCPLLFAPLGQDFWYDGSLVSAMELRNGSRVLSRELYSVP